MINQHATKLKYDLLTPVLEKQDGCSSYGFSRLLMKTVVSNVNSLVLNLRQWCQSTETEYFANIWGVDNIAETTEFSNGLVSTTIDRFLINLIS